MNSADDRFCPPSTGALGILWVIAGAMGKYFFLVWEFWRVFANFWVGFGAVFGLSYGGASPS